MISHSQIVQVLRHYPLSKIDQFFKPDTTDEIICRLLFDNYRKINQSLSKGLKLSTFGLQLLQTSFKNWHFKMPDDYKCNPRHLLYLDRICTMPWYCNNDAIVLFEPQLALKTKLVSMTGGVDLNDLIELFNG